MGPAWGSCGGVSGLKVVRLQALYGQSIYYSGTWTLRVRVQVVLIYGFWYLKIPQSHILGSTWTPWVRVR